MIVLSKQIPFLLFLVFGLLCKNIVICSVSYEDLYRNNEYLADLPNLISRCMMGGGGAAEINNSNHSCKEADYMNRIRSAQSARENIIVSTVTPSILIIKETLSYERLFSDYISVNQPVKGTLPTPSNYNATSISMNCGARTSNSISSCSEYQVRAKFQYLFIFIFTSILLLLIYYLHRSLPLNIQMCSLTTKKI